MSALTGLASTTQQLLPSRYGQLSSEDFVKLIFTELRNQDPFKPNDSAELLKQIDSIRSIQTNMELGNQLAQVANQSQLSGAGDLLGRYIKGFSTDFENVEGSVVGIEQTSLGAVLELDTGAKVPMSLVQSILAGPPAVPPGG